MPGVTVEAASPALIEKVRTTVTSGSGQYAILALRPGTYTVTFTLPGFTTVVREGIELTSDFTATLNIDIKVGTLEETITVTGESPIVDTQGITQRVVMTAEVREALPTGRNIQAIGIMIPGTTLAVGGGGALSRDVGGSGNLQQSPLQYRGSGDTVQTIEGTPPEQPVRAGRLQRRLLERLELRGVQLCDRRRLGRDGPGRHAREHGAQRRRQLVPRLVIGNWAGDSFGSDNCGSPGVASSLLPLEPGGSKTFNAGQRNLQRRRDPEDLGRQRADRRSDRQEQGLVQLHLQALGLDQDQDRRLLRLEPVSVHLHRGHQPARTSTTGIS